MYSLQHLIIFKARPNLQSCLLETMSITRLLKVTKSYIFSDLVSNQIEVVRDKFLKHKTYIALRRAV